MKLISINFIGGNNKMKQSHYVDIRLTKGEREIAVIQLGARINDIDFLINQAMKDQNKDRVKDLMTLEDSIKVIQTKLLEAL
jgi:hypothetical protein